MHSECGLPYPEVRLCFRCGSILRECFGSQLARDMIAIEARVLNPYLLREHCGFCVMEADDWLLDVEWYPGQKEWFEATHGPLSG